MGNSEIDLDLGKHELQIRASGDFNGDGIITSSDLTGFLAVFGTLCSASQ